MQAFVQNDGPSIQDDGHRSDKQPKAWTTWAQRLLPVLTIVLVLGSLYWLQWSGQQGITRGYPIPTVHIATLPTDIRSHQTIQFSANGNGRDLAYHWTVNSDSYGNGYSNNNQSTTGGTIGQSMHYSFPSSGTYTVTVTVSDALGHNSSDSRQVQVLPVPPIASFTAQVDTGYFYYYSVSCDASASQADAGTTITNYTWDFGDGSGSQSTSYPQASHDYQKAGTYTIKLTVTDETGQVSQGVTQTVTISSSQA